MTPATILVVEDNPITRKMVRFALEKKGYAVLDAPDGRTALTLLAQEGPSLVLQDLILPDIDGFDLLARLRELPQGREIPILAFSGFLTKLDEARVSAVGFDDLITKPIEPSQLVRLIQAYLPPPQSASAAFGRGRRLLVVDDDAVQRKLTCFRLGSLGFSVTPASDGQDALERARAAPPELIVSDVMMPRLDGFGLCAAVREDPRLAHIPVVLVTNTYLEAEDRDLAKRVGATRFVLRTPALDELVGFLRGSVAAVPPSPTPAPIPADVEKERAQRVVSQLEKQVALNQGMTQRCAQLAAELSVLSGISDALSRHEDIDTALDDVLAACFDAGGISVGALYLLAGDGGFRVRRFGAHAARDDDQVASFYGEPQLLAAIVNAGAIAPIPSPAIPEPQGRALLARMGGTSGLIVPLIHQEERLGALFMVSNSIELNHEDRIAFARSVASQIAQALVLARTFAAKASSEREARVQAAVLRSIIDSIADAIMVADERGRITLWNRTSEALVPADAALLRPDQTVPYPADELPLARAVRGESVDRAEIYLRSPHGRDGRWLSVNARPLRDENGVARGGVAVFRDVTLEKATQEQLTVSDRMASVGTLAAGVAHEINNPLSSVAANVDLAVRDLAVLAAEMGPSPALAEIEAELRDAREAALRVRQIVRDLRIFSRSDEDRRGPVDVERVLDSSLRMAANEIRHRARLVKVYGGVPPVEANESRLGQVFLNLIVNAAQAITEGRADHEEIRVTTRVAGDGRVVVDIEDTGHGMAPEVLRRLFTPFFTTKPQGVGTGLGLSICHRIVTGLGGEITVDSEVRKGSAFHVALPAAQPEAMAEPEPHPSAALAAGRRGRILIIDDEPKIVTCIRRTLAPEHDVTPVGRAVAALELLKRGARFDVILCDLMMPEMSGIDFFAALTKLAPEQARRIVFLTGGAFTPRARAFLDDVPNQRIEKPFDTHQLRALIHDRVRAG